MRMPPDEVRTCSNGPPPFTVPRSSRRSTRPTTVIGYCVSMRPELECASSENAGLPANSIVTLPDEDDKRQSEVCSPCTLSVPLDVDARTPPRRPESSIEPEPDDASTWPPLACETTTEPLPVLTVMPPFTFIPSIEPLPELAENDPPTVSALIEPEPVVARTSPPASRTRIDPDPPLPVTTPRSPSITCEPEPLLAGSLGSGARTSAQLIDTCSRRP